MVKLLGSDVDIEIPDEVLQDSLIEATTMYYNLSLDEFLARVAVAFAVVEGVINQQDFGEESD